MIKRVVVLFVLASVVGQAQDLTKTRQKDFNVTSGPAIQGYDPVTYFLKSKAMEGKKEYALEHQGITYWFSTPQNKELFKANPQKYEPQYGGWCAYAMGANNEKVEIDPETFKIVNGKLYLFYNAYFNNTLKSWNKDENTLKKKADLNWQSFVTKK